MAEVAARVAADIPDGSYVNLGIGLPTGVSGHVASCQRVTFHSENGILGMGPPPPVGEEDADFVDAGKAPCTVLPGGSVCDHSVSFNIVRGGRLDIAVMGALQVSEGGDLANWKVAGQELGSVGGAMDLAIGAKQVWVMMRHSDRSGRAKILRSCSFPLTGHRCVKRIYTELAVMAVTPDGIVVDEIAADIRWELLQSLTEPHLKFAGLRQESMRNRGG